MAPAASDVPTAAPGLRSQPVARIDRDLDVLNAPGSTRQEFQSYFYPRNLGPGDLEQLSPELWEELRLDSSGAEYYLFLRDLEEEEAQGTVQDLDRPPDLSEAAGPSLLGRRFQLQKFPGPLRQVWKPCSLNYIGI